MANFSSKNEGTWFYFDENQEDLGSICIRILSEPESRRINKLTIKTKTKFKQGVRYEERKEDEKLSSRLMWDYVITDWKNISIDGEVAECNIDNKVKLMANPNFMYFITECVGTLNDDAESGKNLAKN